jgi:hypothetical protein
MTDFSPVLRDYTEQRINNAATDEGNVKRSEVFEDIDRAERKAG